MSLVYHNLGRSYLHQDEWPDLMKMFEGYIAVPYDDGKHVATIGIGVNLREKNYLACTLQELGVFTAADVREAERRTANGLPAETTAERDARYNTIVNDFMGVINSNPLSRTNEEAGKSASEEALQNALNAKLQSYVNNTEPFELDEEQAANVKAAIVQGFTIGPIVDQGKEKKLDTKLQMYGVTINHDTIEYEVLMSRFYNGEGLVSSDLIKAFRDGDRAEAWYWMRYSGYTARNPNTGKSEETFGLVVRRFFEAEMFGLYNDWSGNTVYLDEAKQIYQMFTRHKDDIRDKEAKYGVSFDGILGTEKRKGKTALETANTYSGLSQFISDGTVDTLQQNLDLAKWSILSDLRNRYGEFADKLQDSAIKSTNIYINPTNSDYVLDSEKWETTPAGENDVLIGQDQTDAIFAGAGNDVLIGEGGNDYLEGGKGDDVLIGGSGFDTYYYKAGDGNDQIKDTGENNLVIEKADGTKQKITNFYETGDNVWTTPDGKIEITHHSPWQIELEDGSTLTLGENLQEGDFGIHLKDIPANPILLVV